MPCNFFTKTSLTKAGTPVVLQLFVCSFSCICVSVFLSIYNIYRYYVVNVSIYIPLPLPFRRVFLRSRKNTLILSSYKKLLKHVLCAYLLETGTREKDAAFDVIQILIICFECAWRLLRANEKEYSYNTSVRGIWFEWGLSTYIYRCVSCP